MSSTQQLLLGEGAGGAAPVFIEDVFSTYLYTGTGAALTITNGIDLSTKSGLVWIKDRNTAGNFHVLTDTIRGVNSQLRSNTTDVPLVETNMLQSFTTSGFSLGTSVFVNGNTKPFVGWTFREQPKFFDIVTYTGNGSSTQTISHSLGSIPGCIMVKKTSDTSRWSTYHRSLTAGSFLKLETTDAQAADSFMNGANAPTSTTFTAQLATSDGLNANGATYIAYLWAHDAGGFGLAGTDNVISCGSFTGTGDTGNPAVVNLGYEPQWVMVKPASTTGDWIIEDVMRSFNVMANSLALRPNTAAAEGVYGGVCLLNTGFNSAGGSLNTASQTYIYVAIRRGLMKVPTDATKVFTPALGVATIPNMVAGFPVDSFLGGDRDTPSANNWRWWDRVRGNEASLKTTSITGEVIDEYDYGQFQSMTGFISGNYDGSDKIGWMFRRASGYFDEVCYKGNGSTQSVNHSLGVAPELIIIKWRSGGGTDYGWRVFQKDLGITKWGQFTTDGFSTASVPYPWGTPTSSVFNLGDGSVWFSSNGSSRNFIAYLFATCAGVSKVGSYTGTGATQTIDCGFTGGARFALIKRTDSTGDWYVWDTTRGMVSGTDPSILINDIAAEVNANSVYTITTGFQIVSTAAGINASGGTYIFLAIA